MTFKLSVLCSIVFNIHFNTKDQQGSSEHRTKILGSGLSNKHFNTKTARCKIVKKTRKIRVIKAIAHLVMKY